MSTLKDKLEYLNKGFKNGSNALDNQNSLVFLTDILEELSADAANLIEFNSSIEPLYKACMDELRIAPKETKTVLLKSVLKNIGIDSSIKSDLTTKTPIFEDFLKGKSDLKIYSEINELFDHSFDEKYKRIEVDSLISVTEAALSKNPDNKLLDTFINNENFNASKLSNIMAASLVLKNFSENGTYNLTENQKEVLDNIVISINDAKNKNKEFSDNLDVEVENYNKFMFINSLDVEAQLHEIKKEPEMDGTNGFISSHPIEESLQETLTAKKKRESEIDVISIEWEQKYKDYLNSLITSTSSVKVMSSSNKFKTKFASHGFAPATASLFGDSIVVTDKFGDPQKTLWNVSALTGTMRLSRDVDYSDPRITEQTFAIAALNARRNNWPTVYLNHPGPDNEAKHFLESSITAMVEIGNYNFDEIKVPRKYQHVLDYMKNNHAIIESGLNHENNNTVESTPNNNSETLTVNNDFSVQEQKNTATAPVSEERASSEVEPVKTDITGFDGDNPIFGEESESNPPSFVTEDIGNDDYDYPELGDLKLDESSQDLLSEKDKIDNDDNNPKERRVRLFKNQ